MTDPMEARLRALLDARAAEVTDADVASLVEVLGSLPARRRRRVPAWLAAAAVLGAIAVAAGLGAASLLGPVRLGPVARPSAPPVTQASPSQPTPTPGTATMRVPLADSASAAIYYEGAEQFLELRSGGKVLEHVDRWTAPVTWSGIPPGTYQVVFWVRPCNGSCDLLDAPRETCSAALDVLGGDTWEVRITRRGGEACLIEGVRPGIGLTPTPTPDPAPSLDASVPAWAEHLRDQLECTDASGARWQERGADAPVGRTGTASPYPWLYSLDAIDMPLNGYENLPQSGWEFGASGFARYEYRAGGRVRAVILMEGTSTQGGPGSWAVTAFASCPPDEFDPADGRTTDDLPLVDASGQQAADVTIFGGPAHCDWQSAIFLHVAGQLYLRDPLGVLSTAVSRPWRTLDSLPASAIDSGLASARWHLYTGTGAVVWMVGADGTVEEWPRATEDVGCA